MRAIAGMRGLSRLAIAFAGLAALAIVVSELGVPSAAVAAGNADITITADNPPPPAKPTGSASTYTINFTCSALLGSTCGANPTITIPLVLTSSNAGTPDMTTWAYSVSSTISGLVASGAVVGSTYVITLNEAALHPGDSDTVSLSVTPPNNITPDQTTWSLTPTFTTDTINPGTTAPTAALGAATAAAQLSVSKVTNDGGAIYLRGSNVVYNVTAQCNPSNATGNLYITSGSLVDTLPAGLNFVSASPAPASAPTVGTSGAIEWDYATTASLPTGCSANGAGTKSYTVVATIDPATPNNTALINAVTLTGTPVGTSTPLTTTANRSITAIDTPPSNPGAFVGKTAKAPLNIPNYGFDATYAGHWITPVQARPSTNPGAAEAQYTVSVTYAASRAYTTDLADPVPCLDTLSGVVYSSNSPAGAVNGPGSIGSLCQHPAFNPTALQVSSASLAAAVNTDGWRPTAIRLNGTTFQLALNGTATTSAYFTIPSGELGDIAAIELAPDGALTDRTMSMTVWGYGAATLAGGSALHDIATATAYPVGATSSPVTASHAADVYIQPSAPQLGVFKSFGTLGAAPGGTTALTLQGTVSTPAPLGGNVVLTDLLPVGMTWQNPVTTKNFSLTAGLGGTATSITGTVTDLPNFQSTGRELIRVSFPASSFTSGYYSITPPTNFIELHVPSGATTYNNTGQEFVAGNAQNTAPTCGPGTTSTAATFQSSDPLDLDGDSATVENYCQWAASLTVPPSGGPGFTLVKSVQGDQDSIPKYSPGIGQASAAGSGMYTLQWSNTGGKSLTAPVVYDILPYIGDTGVSQSQSAVARGSQFTPVFSGIIGSLPSGVTVQYSSSTNPCRTEVFPNASNTGCTNDWSSTPPTDVSQVRALEFVAAGTWTPAQTFSVTFGVNVPAGFVNTIAWNSAASDASYNGTPLLPAEPPKVGLTAPAPPLTPTLATSATAATALPGTAVGDTITVGTTGGGAGSVAWSLVGPITPAVDGTCNGLTWSSAATLASGTVAVSGNGSYSTPTTSPVGAGCYSYVETLTGSGFAAPVSSLAGTSGETVLVHAATLATSASVPLIRPGGSVTDAIALSGTGSGSGSIGWQLVGPVAPAADGTCGGLDWSGAPTFDQGTIAVTGDATYTTTASTVTAPGCYSYVELLSTASAGGPSTSVAGTTGETVLVATPSLATTVSAASIVTGGTVSDVVTVAAIGANPGSIAWQLVGPVTPAADGTCNGLDWSTAATLDQGTIAVPHVGSYTTAPSTPTVVGCYGYVTTLTGTNYGGPVTSVAGAPGEVVQASAPPVTPGPPLGPLPTPSATPTPVNLSIVKRVSSATATFGEPLTYTIVVTNNGPNTAAGASVTDTPKTAMAFVSARSSQATCGSGFPLTCKLVTLAPGAQAHITVVATPLVAGSIANGAQVDAAAATTNTAPSHAVLAAVASNVMVPLKLTKTASAPVVRAGGHLGYTITVKNPTHTTARAVRLCDRLPAGLVFVSASIRTHLRNGSHCATITSIARGKTVAVTLAVRALAGAHGALVNTATIGGPSVEPRIARAPVRVLAANVRAGGVTG